MPSPTRFEWVGGGLVVSLTVLTLVLLSTVGVMKTASSDLHNQLDIAHGYARADTRSPIGSHISPLLASDLPANDLDAMNDRAILLDDRSDRLLEATAVVALVGMLASLIVARPASAS